MHNINSKSTFWAKYPSYEKKWEKNMGIYFGGMLIVDGEQNIIVGFYSLPKISKNDLKGTEIGSFTYNFNEYKEPEFMEGAWYNPDMTRLTYRSIQSIKNDKYIIAIFDGTIVSENKRLNSEIHILNKNLTLIKVLKMNMPLNRLAFDEQSNSIKLVSDMDETNYYSLNISPYID